MHSHSLIIVGARHKLSVIASLSWKPFDAIFEDLLDNLMLHREVIEDELQLDQYKKALEKDETLAAQLHLHAEEKALLLNAKKRLEEIHTLSQDMYKGSYEQYYYANSCSYTSQMILLRESRNGCHPQSSKASSKRPLKRSQRARHSGSSNTRPFTTGIL